MSEMTIIPDLYLEGNSKQWKNRQAIYLDIKTCEDCRKNHGKIYNRNAKRYQPEHLYCRCSVIPMRTKEVGTATDRGFDGADAWLLYRNRLPDYYVTKEEAIVAGWRSKKANLHEVLPGKMIGGNIYENKRGLLPSKLGRVWREADFDFVNGYRNSKRILYSNDGLIFVSFDHAQTFYELVK